MSTTELDEVQALLEHVLPDPAGFAQRLALQVMARWGQSAEPGAGTSYTAARAEDGMADGIVIRGDRPDMDEAPVDTNMLLAVSLGACECWGLRANCTRCGGHGSAGWVQPDPELFEVFIKPAIAKLSGTSADDHQQHGRVKSGEGSDKRQTAKGEKV
jgi:hypothetical protein